MCQAPRGAQKRVGEDLASNQSMEARKPWQDSVLRAESPPALGSGRLEGEPAGCSAPSPEGRWEQRACRTARGVQGVLPGGAVLLGMARERTGEASSDQQPGVELRSALYTKLSVLSLFRGQQEVRKNFREVTKGIAV